MRSAALRLAVACGLLLLLGQAACTIACDAPRREVVVRTLDGYGRHECVAATSSPH